MITWKDFDRMWERGRDLGDWLAIVRITGFIPTANIYTAYGYLLHRVWVCVSLWYREYSTPKIKLSLQHISTDVQKTYRSNRVTRAPK